MFSRNLLTSCRAPSKDVSCLRRALATEASLGSSTTATSTPPPASSKRSTRPKITTAIILNRSPTLTRTPTPFERAYYAYQARIRRALHNPFPYEFYFKQGSLLETRFNIEEAERERLAFGKDFTGEVVTSEKEEANKRAVAQLSQQEGEGEVIMPRTHESDIKKDFKSLDRKGARNLYLLLRVNHDGKQVWRFPQGGVEKGELLHQAAQRDLFAECGPHMDTWIVSRNPVGVSKSPSEATKDGQEDITFFYKAHIMAGQVRPTQASVSDFAWLTKEEIESHVSKDYWEDIKDMLSRH
ncbi:54S ribosomal protein L17 mitochondrial [Pleurotus pulmonarius]|nr:54S ribosomal protein L17 mitochondrial [Pleurotus pulmonarius]KAF4604059.1 54S ribosomal protein L17 mitochondrial [Pleurotus pulmonarius]KAF4608889.1 54S ribosomal protein L17 mitochondrial [Pleurotus pulmonarius]